MNIRTKLTLAFFCIVIVVVSAVSLSIYYFSAAYREHDFFRRLKNRAINTAKLLIEYEEVDASLLQRMERDNPANLPMQRIVVFNYKNQIMFMSEGTIDVPTDSALLNRVRLDGEVRFTREMQQVLGFMHTDRYDRFTVIATAVDTNGLDALHNLRSILLITFAASVVVVSVLGWIFSGRVLRPISRIVSEVDNITEENLEKRLDEGNNNDELGKLARTFNKMLVRLQRAFFAQRSFIANASHEIKTPITVMAGQIEVSLMQRRMPEYYIETLRSVLDGIKGMNKLSNQLLLLAQTSSDVHEFQFQQIRMDDVIWSAKEELSKAHPSYEIDVRFDIQMEDKDFTVVGEIELLRVAVLNLMDNGCKYSTDNTVVVTVNSHHDHLIVEFVNHGKTISFEEESRIFEPFFRGASGKKAKGFGIGLPLTKRIMDLHRASIRLDNSQPGFTRFVISLSHRPDLIPN